MSIHAKESTEQIKACVFLECGRASIARNLCVGHWKQWRLGKQLTTLRHKRPNNTPPEIRYYEKECPRSDLKSPCHIFAGNITNKGYGRTSIKKKHILVHVYVWLKHHGMITDGKEIDHQCHVRSCCNINHLREVTHQVNMTENCEGMRWQQMKAKTHCAQGHPFDEGNTYRNKNKRFCRKCRTRWDRLNNEKKKHAQSRIA